MKTSTVVGIAFAAIAALVVIGAVALTGANAGQVGPRPGMLDILGLGWMFLLWGGLVTISVFIIAWVAESMGAAEEAANRDEASPAAAPPSPSPEAPDRIAA